MPGYSISLIRILNWKIHFLVWVGVYVCVCVSAAVCTNCLCLCESLWKHAHESSSCYVEKDTYEFEINSILPHKIPRTCAPTLSHAHTHTLVHIDVCVSRMYTHTLKKVQGLCQLWQMLTCLPLRWLQGLAEACCGNNNNASPVAAAVLLMTAKLCKAKLQKQKQKQKWKPKQKHRKERTRRKRQRHRTITRGKTKRYVKGERVDEGQAATT